MTTRLNPPLDTSAGTSDTLWHAEYGTGIPVVMIHGYTADHRLLLPLEDAFTENHHFRRIYMDLPGHGNSRRLDGPASADALTEAVIGWINSTLDDEPFAVVGQSFGGQIARAVTARFGPQVLGSALLAPVVRWGDDRTLPSTTTISRDDALLHQLPEGERALFGLVMAQLDPVRYDKFKTHLMPGWNVHDQDAAKELEANFLLPHQPELPALRHEGVHLLITGRQDALVGWEDQMELLKHYPRMSAVIIDSSGHNPQLETPETVNHHLTSWLDHIRLG